VPSKLSPEAFPPTQTSDVQALASLQSALVVQVTFATLLQFPAGSVHVSVVPALPSLQSAFAVQHPLVGAYA
jgi:hypothetical protein